MKIYNNSSEYESDLKYWCNACGELHHFGEYDITEEELPEDLKTPYAAVWKENPDGNYCYLVNYKGTNYIALINEYYELEGNKPCVNNFERAQAVAEDLDNQGYAVLLAKELGFPSSDGDATELVILLPTTIEKKEFDRISKHIAEIAYI